MEIDFITVSSILEFRVKRSYRHTRKIPRLSLLGAQIETANFDKNLAFVTNVLVINKGANDAHVGLSEPTLHGDNATPRRW